MEGSVNNRLPVGFVALLIALAGCSGGANLPSAPANQAATSQQAQAQTQASGRTVHSRPSGSPNFQVLYTFQDGTDGGNPFAGLTADSSGNLYGTTSSGGSGYGTAFELKNAAHGYKYVVLHTFAGGNDGANPYARLILGTGGKLYGTTVNGGSGGAGTVFELLPGKTPRNERVLYTFTQSAQGANPSAGDLTIDANGAIYGTTQNGGAFGQGTVFKLSGAHKEKVLYSFGATASDGTQPYAGVTFDRAGNIYGTTSLGGEGYGTVFELTPSKSKWIEQTIHTFGNVTDGGTPYAGLSFDAQGNLFGSTTQGPGDGGGTFFELTPSGKSWSFNTIYSLSGWGISGEFRTAYLDPNDNIIGTTHCDGQYSSGSVYELQRSGSTYNYVDLYDFTGGTDGQYVFSNPAFDAKGDIFGTTNVGGSGYGVVWEVRAASQTGRLHVNQPAAI
jgi:uncharacterized repeat protein (TIGR03803 family)